MTGGARLAAAACLLAGALGAALVARHDAGVALGAERWFGPAAVVAAHAVLVLVGAALGSWRWTRLAPYPLYALAVGFWLAALPVAPRAPPAPAPPAAGDAVVVLLTLDTFRADHAGPALRALAAGGVDHRQAVATAPLTAPSHASMLTGLETVDHGLVANGRTTCAPTVVERLHAAGWATAAFVGAHVLDRHTGLDRGFDHYDDRWGWGQRLGWHPLAKPLGWPRRTIRRPGEEVVDRALAWLGTRDRPSFVWVHLYDSHAPYQPPPAYAPRPEAVAVARERDRELRRDLPATDLLTRARAGRREELRLRYRAVTAWTDSLVGRLVAGLPEGARGVVVGDHGEGLGEHEEWFNHGATVWEPALRVPLVSFGIEPPRVEPGLYSTASVHDLLLAAAGLGPPPGPLQQVRAYTPGQQAELTLARIRSRDHAAAALRVDGGALLANPGAPVAWFDLETDPDQARPLPVPEALTAEVAPLEALRAWAVPALAPPEAERLRTLGYVE